MTGARATALLLAASLALATQSARAGDDVDEARRLFIEGSRLAQKGDWPEARVHFERSLARKRAPLTLYSLGVAQRATGALVQAQDSLRAFLAEPGTPATQSYQQAAKQAVDELEREVGRLRLSVEGAPASTLELDGVALAPAALAEPVRVNPGPHRLHASGVAGDLVVDVVVASGATQALTVRLAPRSASAPTPAPSARAPSAPPRALPFALLGAGAVTLAAGVAIGAVGASQAHASPTRDGAEADAARTKALVGDVVGGVGVAAMAAGVGVLLFAPRAPRAAWVAPWVAGASAGVSGAF